MKNKTLKYIFSIIFTSVLLIAGCGSSSNNPLSSGNTGNDLVLVRGNVNNLTGNGSVSFYTPTAAARNGLNVSTPFRASVSNDGVYTFYTDENGEYSGQIPSGDYYVIAQNSDGTMKSVSAKQTFTAPRASKKVTQNFTLNRTLNISGQLSKELDTGDSSIEDVESAYEINANIPVFIEGLPFVAVTDSNGKFTFNSVPAITDSNTYTIKASINIEGATLIASQELKKSDFPAEGNLTLSKELKFDFSSVIDNCKFIQGFVYQNGSESNPVKGVIVVALLNSGKILTSLTEENGEFSVILSPSEDTSDIQITADMLNYQTAKVSNTLQDLSGKETPTSVNIISVNAGGASNDAGIIITESYDDVFIASSENTLRLFEGNTEINSERVYQKIENYSLSNLEVGKSYSYMLESRNYESYSYGYRFSDSITAANPYTTADSANTIIEITHPEISVYSLPNSQYSMNAKIVKYEGALAKYEAFAYAINTETDKFQSVMGNVVAPSDSTIRAAATSPIDDTHTLDLDELASGTYNIYAGYSIIYNNNYVATITSDPFQFVKH